MEPPGRPAPALMEELVEEVLLRLPPDDPASLVRAALVCKRWSRLVSDPGFRRRFREFHRAPPMLGIFYRHVAEGESETRFTATSSFCLPDAGVGGCRDWRVLDARHGRIVFFRDTPVQPEKRDLDLFVWNPITSELKVLPSPGLPQPMYIWNAALVCNALGCDHLDCPFIVVFLAPDHHTRSTSTYIFSSEAGCWSKTASIEHPQDWVVGRAVLVDNALYFRWQFGNGILQYDLGKHELSMISLPSVCHQSPPVLITKEDGGLGFVIVQGFNLHVWSWESSLKGWTLHRIIELKRLLPASALSTTHRVIAYAEGADVIFIWTRVGVFAIELKSGRTRMVFQGDDIYRIVPYVSFCTPALRADHADG